MIHIHLENPKTPANVGGVLRALSCFDGDRLTWTGKRVEEGILRYAGTKFPSKRRLPREERMKKYNIDYGRDDDGLDDAILRGLTPVCVEVLPHAISLPVFIHPRDAVYVLGPEDGSVSKGVRMVCHYFVRIPSNGCMNLAAVANVLLYDRRTKELAADGSSSRRQTRVPENQP